MKLDVSGLVGISREDYNNYADKISKLYKDKTGDVFENTMMSCFKEKQQFKREIVIFLEQINK